MDIIDVHIGQLVYRTNTGVHSSVSTNYSRKNLSFQGTSTVLHHQKMMDSLAAGAATATADDDRVGRSGLSSEEDEVQRKLSSPSQQQERSPPPPPPSRQQEQEQQITSNAKRSYKNATGRFKLLCTFDALFATTKHNKGDDHNNINDNNDNELLKTAKILKTLVSNARTKQHDPKYQIINLDNPKIRQSITTNEPAMDLLHIVGFEKKRPDDSSNDDNNNNNNSLIYKASTITQFQDGSKLESLLDEKIMKLQREDSCRTFTQKSHKTTSKAKQKEAKQTRQTELNRFKDDRERQKQMF